MIDDVTVKVEKVSKTFKLPHEKSSTLKSTVINFYKRDRGFDKQQALENVSFEVKKGEFFGIVGKNGSGKSTLLKILAGIYSPDSGNITVKGKLIPFIELGVGFSPELSGRDNVFLNGSLLGFSRNEMKDMYNDIVEFAEIERFMDQKLKNYSSGMQVRLAFSIAIRAKSDILLLDEVLAVGDAAFQTKCFDYFAQLKQSDTTVVFVSHDRGSLERFCERGILLNDGDIVAQGDIKSVLKEYDKIVMGQLEGSSKINEHEEKPEEELKQNKSVQVIKVKTYGANKTLKNKFNYNETIWIDYEAKINEDIVNPIAGVTIWKKNVERPIYATNTLIEGISKTGSFKKGDKIYFKTQLPGHINDGEFYIDAAVSSESGAFVYDEVNHAREFFISGSDNPYSLVSSSSKAVFLKIEPNDNKS